MPDDNIPSQKYRDTGISWRHQLQTTSAVLSPILFPTSRGGKFTYRYGTLHSCAMSHNEYVNFLPVDVVVMLLAFMLWVLMYADICCWSHLHAVIYVECCGRYLASPRYTVTFNTAVFFWYRYAAHPYFLIRNSCVMVYRCLQVAKSQSNWIGNDYIAC